MWFFERRIFRNSERLLTGSIHVKGLQHPRGWGPLFRRVSASAAAALAFNIPVRRPETMETSLG
jgi:hypothetical protein